jgi:hypothetical protein
LRRVGVQRESVGSRREHDDGKRRKRRVERRQIEWKYACRYRYLRSRFHHFRCGEWRLRHRFVGDGQLDDGDLNDREFDDWDFNGWDFNDRELDGRQLDDG